MGVDRDLVKIRGFVFQAAKPKIHPDAIEHWDLKAQRISELGQQLSRQRVWYGLVQVGGRSRYGGKENNAATNRKVWLNPINGRRLEQIGETKVGYVVFYL